MLNFEFLPLLSMMMLQKFPGSLRTTSSSALNDVDWGEAMLAGFYREVQQMIQHPQGPISCFSSGRLHSSQYRRQTWVLQADRSGIQPEKKFSTEGVRFKNHTIKNVRLSIGPARSLIAAHMRSGHSTDVMFYTSACITLQLGNTPTMQSCRKVKCITSPTPTTAVHAAGNAPTMQLCVHIKRSCIRRGYLLRLQMLHLTTTAIISPSSKLILTKQWPELWSNNVH